MMDNKNYYQIGKFLFLILILICSCNGQDKDIIGVFIYNTNSSPYGNKSILVDNDILEFKLQELKVRNSFNYDRDTIVYFGWSDTLNLYEYDDEREFIYEGKLETISEEDHISNCLSHLWKYKPNFKIDSLLKGKTIILPLLKDSFSIYLSDKEHPLNNEKTKEDYGIYEARYSGVKLNNDIIDYIEIDKYSFVYEDLSPQPILYLVGAFSNYIGIIIDSITEKRIEGRIISNEPLVLNYFNQDITIEIRDSVLGVYNENEFIHTINNKSINIDISTDMVYLNESMTPLPQIGQIQYKDIETLEMELDKETIRIFSDNRLILLGAYNLDWNAGIIHINYGEYGYKKAVLSRNGKSIKLSMILEVENQNESMSYNERMVTFQF